MKKVVVIGGGIIGQFCAYYLSKSGHGVVIVDDNPDMPPASAGNCGLITPSHIPPINSWAAMLQGLKWMGKKDAPLSIKPQANVDFVKWFFSFARHASQSKIRTISDYRHQILSLTWSLYNQFFEQESIKTPFHKRGLLMVSHSKSGLEAIHEEHEIILKHGLPSQTLTSDEVQALEHSVRENEGGALFECDGWLDPIDLLREIKVLNASNGVEFIDKKFYLSESGDRVNSEIEADKYILAAGAKSYQLAKEIGLRLPMIPGKGYNLTASKALANQPSRPVYMFDKKVVFTPWETGFRLGSTMEFTGFDLTLNEHRLNALKNASDEYLNLDISKCQFEPWAGWRPMTPDGLPIIQQSRKYQNLVFATGHGMLGLTMAPATGYLVDCLVNEKPHDLHTLRAV